MGDPSMTFPLFVPKKLERATYYPLPMVGSFSVTFAALLVPAFFSSVSDFADFVAVLAAALFDIWIRLIDYNLRACLICNVLKFGGVEL